MVVVMKIVLRPVTTYLDNSTLNHLAEDISKEFRAINVTVACSIELDKAQFQLAFDKQRKQWDSSTLLEWLLGKFTHNKGTKILALIDIDAYSNSFDIVFGKAYYHGRIAAVYLARLRQEFYGLKQTIRYFMKCWLKNPFMN
jgi:archaemetzincin